MPVYVDENGKPVATATPPPTYVDENGNPVATKATPAAARVANVMAAKGVARYPGDPISQIEARKRNPPATRFGDPSIGTEYGVKGVVGSLYRGVQGLLGVEALDPTSPKFEELFAPTEDTPTPRTIAEDNAAFVREQDQRKAELARQGMVGSVRSAVSHVPLVGDQAAAVLAPAGAVAENRPVSPQENDAAIQSGIGLAATIEGIGKIAPAAAARVRNVLRARGAIPEVVAGAAAEPVTPVSSGNAAIDAERAKGQAAIDESRSGAATVAAKAQAAFAPIIAPVKEFAAGVNPAGASPQAADAADILRDSKAQISNAATLERYKNAETAKAFDRAGDEKNIESISNFEITGRFMKGGAFEDQAAADTYSKMYQETTDAAHESLQQTYGDDRVGYVENYVRRAFKFGSATDEAKATGVLSNYVGSLSASKSPLKGRVLNMPLDDALTAMRDAGIDVKPATTNPELLRQWTVENANQARAYKQAWTDADKGGLVKYVEREQRVPEGLVQLDDRVAKVFSRGDSIRMGRETWQRAAQIEGLGQLKELHGQQRATAKSLADTSKLFDRTDKAFADAVGSASKRLSLAENSADALYEKARTMAADQSLRSDITPILDRGIATEQRIGVLSEKLAKLSTGDLASKRAELASAGTELMNAMDERAANISELGKIVDAGPDIKAPVRQGQYFAEPGVARIFNNAISKGLGGSPTFRAVRAMNNAYNQVQLGLSGFHLTGTAINAGISDLSLGLQQIINGDVGAAAKSIGRSTVPAYSFVRDMVNGRNFVNDLLADDPIAKQILDEKFNPAGGRLAIDQSYRNSAYDNMVKAWSNRRYIRALGNVPFAVIQKVASPLMEYAIPRVKIGAFLDLAEANRAKLGDTPTDTQVQRAYEQAWDSVDNRFGQIVHDNLFWNRTAADLAQVSTRSVGWNLGTIRELGGGAVDLAKGNVSQRTLYALALPIYAGTIGGIFHYLHTGKRPESARDLYYPQNGLKDAKGRDDRASLPTYMKDVFAYTSDPVGTVEHKASPLASLTFDLGTNRDYFGDMIRNPEETRSKQLLQMGSYALKQFRPFSVQQAAKTLEEGGVLRAGEQIMGFPSAPAAMKQTAEESEQFKEARRLRNENAMDAAKKKHGG